MTDLVCKDRHTRRSRDGSRQGNVHSFAIGSAGRNAGGGGRTQVGPASSFPSCTGWSRLWSRWRIPDRSCRHRPEPVRRSCSAARSRSPVGARSGSLHRRPGHARREQAPSLSRWASFSGSRQHVPNAAPARSGAAVRRPDSRTHSRGRRPGKSRAIPNGAAQAVLVETVSTERPGVAIR